MDVREGSRPVIFPGRENRGRIRVVDVITGRRAGRPGSDAPRVEKLGLVRRGQQARPFGEERTPFGKSCGERRQIDLCGIRFHLAEIGVERGFERETGPEPHLEIGAHAAQAILTARRKDCSGLDSR